MRSRVRGDVLRARANNGMQLTALRAAAENPPIRDLEEIRRDCVGKLKAVQVSEHFLAMLSSLLGENWATPRLVAMVKCRMQERSRRNMPQPPTNATPFKLMLEDHANVVCASPDIIEQALAKMLATPGPTFIQLKDANRTFAQAGGYADRYRAESYDEYGEGYQHFLAATPACTERSPTAVLYRNRCIEGVHPYRQCPLDCTVANVLSYQDMWNILMHYAHTGQRASRYAWNDVTGVFYGSPGSENNEHPITQFIPECRTKPPPKNPGR